MNKYKFVIISPHDLCGGTIVLHTLCKYIRELGYSSKILYSCPMIRKNENPLKFKIKYFIKWIIYNMKDILCIIRVKLFGFSISEKEKEIYNLPSLSGCRRKYTPFIDKNTIVIYPDVIYGNFLNSKLTKNFLIHF